MKLGILLSVLAVLGSALLPGCATMPKTWPDYARSAESKMVVIQEKIGDGLKTGMLTPDQTQMFLTTLKGIRLDYNELRDKVVYRDEWDRLFGRLDMLDQEIDRALIRPAKIEGRDVPMKWRQDCRTPEAIDDGKISGRLPVREEQEIQASLDSIRREYLHMTDDGRNSTYEERTDISRRLDLLEAEMSKYR